MKSLLHYLIAMASAIILLSSATSCSSDKSADARDLLASVPSDVALVAVSNTQTILQKLGCTVSDSKVNAPKDLDIRLHAISDPNARAIFKSLADGNNAVEPSAIVIFCRGYYTFISGYVADASAFKNLLTEECGLHFSTEDKINIAQNVALSDNRFWINLNQSSIDARDIRHFLTLAKEQSFLANKFSENLCSIQKDIEGWCSIAGMLNTADLDFQNRATAQIALETMFEDAIAASFSVEFTKGEARVSANLLNSNGKHAKFLLPTNKIDIETVASIGGKADMIAAISLPSKLIEKLKRATSSQAPSMLGALLSTFGSIDGTAAFAASDEDNVRGVLTTNGQNSSSLVELLRDFDFTVTKENNLLRIAKGNVTGDFEVAVGAKLLKGAIAGIAVANPAGKLNLKFPGLESSALLIVPQNDVSLQIVAHTNQPKENFLLTVIK